MNIKHLVFLALFSSIVALGSSVAIENPVRTTVDIQAGLQAGYNLDQKAFGFRNIIRKVGLWIEFFNSDAGAPSTAVDPEADGPQVSIQLKNFKYAVSTFSNTDVPYGWNAPTTKETAYSTDGDGFVISLNYKGFWLGLVNSNDGKKGGFNFAGIDNGDKDTTSSGPYLSSRSSVLLANTGLFIPDSNDWDNSPVNLAPKPTYYTYSPLGSETTDGLDLAGPLTGNLLTVNPFQNVTKGLAYFGYTNPLVTVKGAIGSKASGVSLFSKADEVNSSNATNFQGDLVLSLLPQWSVKIAGLGGVNYTNLEGGNPYALGMSSGYALNVGENLFLVPTVGVDYINQLNAAKTEYLDKYEISGGLKFLWGGDGPAGKNNFNSKETYRGASATSIYQNSGRVDLQFALFEPAARSGLVKNLGVQAFGEVKNVTGLATVDSGKSLWGAGTRIDYAMAASNLNPYLYLHYKNNQTAANSGQLITRAGFLYSGIQSLTIDAYYLMGRLTTDSTNLGNIACNLMFTY